ncbi:MAG: hypothetical protein HQM16_01835 [Deltaproteobacteria bacterium]|nr:hypothetical protein [Deltaproteobacteria bacterium]
MSSASHAQNTYTLPESYYNSLKNNASSNADDISLSTAKPDLVVAANTAVTSPSPTAIQTKTTTAFKPEEFNQSYVISQIGSLRAEIESMKKGLDADKTAGYDGGFFVRSSDKKYALSINGRIQAGYSFNIAEDFEDGHTFALRSIRLVFGGNLFNEKLVYTIAINPNSSLALNNFEIGYKFIPEFGIFVTRQSVSISGLGASPTSTMFISYSMPTYNYDFANAIGLAVNGGIKWFSYAITVTNSEDMKITANLNNELCYAARFDFNLFGKYDSGTEGDFANTEKPAMTAGFGADFGHLETGTQARIIGGAADVKFKYAGFSLIAGGIIRQIDPDMFTRAQLDMGLEAKASYFLIKKKLEVALRGAGVIDDMTNSYLNLMTARSGDNDLPGQLGGGDVDGDPANEWEGGVCFGYYFVDKNAKLQAEYKMTLDGIVGPDDRIYHVGMLQATLAF